MKKPITCCICGRNIEPGQRFETSKPRKGPEVHAHVDCLKKKEAPDK